MSPLRQFMDGISSEHVRDETREENPFGGKLFFFFVITQLDAGTYQSRMKKS